MADPPLTEVDFNPFARAPFDPNKLTPVEGNPFETTKPTGATPSGPRSYAAADVPGEAMTNFLPSIGKQLKEMYEGLTGAISDPIQTARTLSSFGVSVSPLGPLAQSAQMMLPHMPEAIQKALGPVLTELNAPKAELTADLVKTYGGWDNVKHTLAEDPARVLMDAAAIASGGEMALARVAPKAAKVLGAATNLDPLTAAANAGAKAIEHGAPALLGQSTGVGAAPIKEAYAAGREGGERGANFWKAYNEGVPAEEIIAKAEQGVNNIKQRMQQVYASRKNDKRFGWGEDQKPLNFAPIEKAWNDLVDSYTTKSGKRLVGDAEWKDIQKVGEVVAEWGQDIQIGKSVGTADDLDGLKRRIQAIYPSSPENRQTRRAVTKMAGAVRSEITKQVPGYARAMKDYAEASEHLDELRRAFSLGDKASIQTKMSQLQSVLRNNANTQYGHRTKMLADLEREGAVSIRPELAGSALSSLEPRGLARVGTGAGAGFGLGSVLGSPIVGGAVGLAASSPKIVGGVAHGAGRVVGTPDALARRLPAKIRPQSGYAYLPFGRGARNAYRMFDMMDGETEERARGGYFRHNGC